MAEDRRAPARSRLLFLLPVAGLRRAGAALRRAADLGAAIPRGALGPDRQAGRRSSASRRSKACRQRPARARLLERGSQGPRHGGECLGVLVRALPPGASAPGRTRQGPVDPRGRHQPAGQPDNARRFLGALGNPYAAVGVDPNGRASIDWGVYGVPETFIIGPDGTIRHKHIGPLTPETIAGVQGAAAANPARLSRLIATSSARQEGRAVLWRKRLRPARHVAHGAQVLHQVAGGERHADGGFRERACRSGRSPRRRPSRSGWRAEYRR